MPEMPPFPWQVALSTTWAVLSNGRRSLRRDALRCTRRVQIRVQAGEHIPQAGPGVVLVNHYYRPGFSAAWIALCVSAAVPQELVWVMSAAWTEADTVASKIKAALSVPLYPRLARVYGLISMPPMPPRPHEIRDRALAVRKILAVAQQKPGFLLAIAPEGRDSPGGVLGQPPPGVGRLLAKLAKSGVGFFPVGVFEQADQVVLNFGHVFRLTTAEGLSSQEIDRQTADTAMRAIAALLPPELRGDYAD